MNSLLANLSGAIHPLARIAVLLYNGGRALLETQFGGVCERKRTGIATTHFEAVLKTEIKYFVFSKARRVAPIADSSL
jgi:hypothetical protein